MPDNPIARIHAARGQRVAIDSELFRLLTYAGQCYQMSDGRFDRPACCCQVWKFDGSDRLPDSRAIERMLPWVGWHRVQFGEDWILSAGRDGAGSGRYWREYAVDRVLLMVLQQLQQWGYSPASGQSGVLVNFGGDLASLGPRPDGQAWAGGIENAALGEGVIQTCCTDMAVWRPVAMHGVICFYVMASAMGHIPGSTHRMAQWWCACSVTVSAATCTLAGMLATFAMLYGSDAETFCRHKIIFSS